MNATMKLFGYPEGMVKEYEFWVLLLRPEQLTIGSLMLINKSEATSMGELSAEAFAELSQVTADTEKALDAAFAKEKINYLCFMLRDPHVHFHVLPRYSTDKTFAGLTFSDPTWPVHADFSHKTELTAEQFTELKEFVKSHF